MTLNRKRFLRVYGADAKRWAARHGLAPFTAPCSRCGEQLHTSVPFAAGLLRGLIAPTCTCGNARTPYCVVLEGQL